MAAEDNEHVSGSQPVSSFVIKDDLEDLKMPIFQSTTAVTLPIQPQELIRMIDLPPVVLNSDDNSPQMELTPQIHIMPRFDGSDSTKYRTYDRWTRFIMIMEEDPWCYCDGNYELISNINRLHNEVIESKKVNKKILEEQKDCS